MKQFNMCYAYVCVHVYVFWAYILCVGALGRSNAQEEYTMIPLVYPSTFQQFAA